MFSTAHYALRSKFHYASLHLFALKVIVLLQVWQT